MVTILTWLLYFTFPLLMVAILAPLPVCFLALLGEGDAEC